MLSKEKTTVTVSDTQELSNLMSKFKNRQKFEGNLTVNACFQVPFSIFHSRDIEVMYHKSFIKFSSSISRFKHFQQPRRHFHKQVLFSSLIWITSFLPQFWHWQALIKKDFWLLDLAPSHKIFSKIYFVLKPFGKCPFLLISDTAL